MFRTNGYRNNSPQSSLSNSTSRPDSGYGEIPMEVNGVRRSLAATVFARELDDNCSESELPTAQKGSLVVRASIGLGSLRTGTQDNLSTSVTQVINGNHDDPMPVSETLRRPPSCNSIRMGPNSPSQSNSCPAQEVLGTVTIGGSSNTSPPERQSGNKRPCVIQPVKPQPQKIQIFVTNINGKTMTFKVYASDTVLTLQQLIREKTGIPIDQLRLEYAGKNLVSGLTLGYYDIKEKSTIFIKCCRLRGG